MKFTHLTQEGKAKMVDVSSKPISRRMARAEGRIKLSPQTMEMIKASQLKKGDVLAVARIAGISGAKKTADLIPLCHNIVLDQVGVDFELEAEGVKIKSWVICQGKTGVEMEALTAVAVAALTIYDMCKAVDKQMVIEHIYLTEKKKDEV
ncbi:MAG TPA: cyclic pyranopterin monophosphate synthase MoaC [Candidatus Aminicenantes bacterium]|nr:cyclic pyranopterin monophosphate synthase MoaC [Candidatus Aminicenantes bacterium]